MAVFTDQPAAAAALEARVANVEGQIEANRLAAFTYQGGVADFDSLPENPELNDVWKTEDTGDEWYWDGGAWHAFGPTIVLDTVPTENSANPVSSGGVWAAIGAVPGVPSGGAAGQLLAKASGADHDTAWVNPPQGLGNLHRRLLAEGVDFTAEASDNITQVFYPGGMLAGAGGNYGQQPGNGWWVQMHSVNDPVETPAFAWAEDLRLIFGSIGQESYVTLTPTVTAADRQRAEFTAQHEAQNGDVFDFSGYVQWDSHERYFTVSVFYDAYTPAGSPGSQTVVGASASAQVEDFTDDVNTGQTLTLTFAQPLGDLASFDAKVSGNLVDGVSGAVFLPFEFLAHGMDGDQVLALLQTAFGPEFFPVLVSLDVDAQGQLAIAPSMTMMFPQYEMILSGLQIDQLIVTEVAA